MTRTNRTTRPIRTTGTRVYRALGVWPLLATALMLVALALAGCSKAPAEKAEVPDAASSFMVTVTDDASRTITLNAIPERIVSLAPANTEILFALGLGEKVVGVTSYDDYPAAVADIEKVGDFAGPNMEAVAAADPDIVFATTGVQADVITKLEELGAVVVAVDPQTLDGLYADIVEIGQLTAKTDEAEELVAGMKADVAEVQEAVATAEPVSAFIEIGQNPLFTVGQKTLMNELVTLGGGTNVVAQDGYVPFSAEQLVKADPDVYFATKGSGNDPASLEKRAGYSGLTAVKNGRIVILDDNLVSRPGPRVVEGLRAIAEGLHPDLLKSAQ